MKFSWGPSDSLPRTLLALQVLWLCMGLLTLIFGLDERFADTLGWGEGLKTFVRFCLQFGDFLFIVFSFFNVFLSFSDRYGMQSAAWSSGIIFVLSAVLETVGTQTGYPFGIYTYTENFGPQLPGTVPVAIPLAWCCLVMGFYLILQMVRPGLSATWTSVGVGIGCVVVDYFMEPFAYGVREYWLWEGGEVPLENYFTWFVASVILARWGVFTGEVRSGVVDGRPFLVLVSMSCVFIVGRLVTGL